MPNMVVLYPIYGFADAWDDEPFDFDLLPFDVGYGVRAEDVRSMLDARSLNWARRELGERNVGLMQNVRYAFVLRYGTPGHQLNDDVAAKEEFLRQLAACLRVIRPMRQIALEMHGVLRSDGTLDVRGFTHPPEIMQVPESHKLLHLRTADLHELRACLPEFLRAFKDQLWKFVMAVQFHELGFKEHLEWKPRYLLWSSALEAIYTSHDRDHKGSWVAKERIKWFLGAMTPIYPRGELTSLVIDPQITVEAVVDDIYRLRNYIAHGDRVPDEFFGTTMRQGLDGGINKIEVLMESVSFIIRSSLLKIVREGLLHHFADAAPAEKYFAAAGLTLSQLQKNQQKRP